MLRKIAIALALLATALGLLLLFLVVRALLLPSKQHEFPAATPIEVDEAVAVSHLAQAIKFRTVSNQTPGDFNIEEFTRFHQFLLDSFPLVHQKLRRESVSGLSLLYTWQGSDSTLPPVVLLAHMDVVPVDGASEGAWSHPPFDGYVGDGFIWGRGAIDDKSSVIGILEATEALLAQGFEPWRTIYFAFGHDEEIGGNEGAGKIAALLKERGVKAWFTLDEGSAITQGILPGIDEPIALVSVGEKGYVTLELTVEGKGGHSSNPPDHTSIGILAAAITRIEDAPFEARLGGPMLDMLQYAGPEMSLPFRIVMGNLWLFKPLLKWQFAQDPVTNAALRTSTAVTMIDAGTKENVLPIRAHAVVNFRILPGDTVAEVVEHVTQAVDDERVKINILNQGEAIDPSPVSDTHSDSYALIEKSIRSVMPATPVAPGMTLGATDSKHYYDVAENLYRLQPLVFTSADLATIHGTNEKMEIANWLRGIKIFGEILRNTCDQTD